MLRILSILSLLAGLPVLAPAQVTPVNASCIKGEFVWQASSDASWSLKLKRNCAYQCVNWSGWSGKCDVYADGTYELINGSITFTARHQPAPDSSGRDRMTFNGKRFYVYRVAANVVLNRRKAMYYRSKEAHDGRVAYLLSSVLVGRVDYRLEKDE